MMELERDPTFRMNDIYDLTKDEIRVRTLEKVRAWLLCSNLSWLLHKCLIGLQKP